MEGCRAFCLPGDEDFGITPVEANAAGKPVVAFAGGGALETLEEGVTGCFFDRREPDEVLAAIRRCDRMDTAPEVIASAARRFSAANFRERLCEVIRAGVAAREPPPRSHAMRGATANGAGAGTEAPRRRMRVVFIDHVAQLSGGEIALLRLLPHLDEVDPHVILAEDGPLADRLRSAGITTEVLSLRERTRNLRKDRVTPGTLPFGSVVVTALYSVRLALRLRQLRPDVVHTNSLKSGVYGSIAARLAGIPSVWHVRDRIAVDYLPKTAVRLTRFMTRRLPSVVIANSQATMRTLHPGGSSIVLYSVLPEVLAPPRVPAKRTAEALVVGMVGRLAPWKGQELFLRAFADAFGTSEARCVIIGSSMFGEDEYALGLHSLVGELDLQDHVEFRGFQENVWSEFARLDVLVHASLIPEPFGQVVLEGMAARVPVVVANAGGPAEIVTHGVNGLHYPMGDRAALAAALRTLADDPALRERLATEALDTVAAYQPGAVVSRLQTVYRDVIDRADRPSRLARPYSRRPGRSGRSR